MVYLGCLFSILFFTSSVFGQGNSNSADTNRLALSQGIAAPSVNNTTLFSNGFTFQNPVAVSYEQGYRASVTADGSDTTSFGLDAGLGDGQYGMAIGAYSNSCDGCEAYVRGTLSAIWSGFGLGFGVQEDLYTVGVLFNPNGSHRVGMVGEIAEPNGPNNNRASFGVGYAYVISQFSFSMDLSKRNLEDSSLDDSILMFSPGIAIRIDLFSVSLSYDLFINDQNRNFSDQVWVGVSFMPADQFE
ncbi:MAG: hypothetical protein AAF203_04885, partial [Pseudomonadota bacterium]